MEHGPTIQHYEFNGMNCTHLLHDFIVLFKLQLEHVSIMSQLKYNYMICCMQLTFQVVLSTDGRISFASFIYPDLSSIRQITGLVNTGFNAGDRARLSNIAVDSLGTVNLFRIDGMSTTRAHL